MEKFLILQKNGLTEVLVKSGSTKLPDIDLKIADNELLDTTKLFLKSEKYVFILDNNNNLKIYDELYQPLVNIQISTKVIF